MLRRAIRAVKTSKIANAHAGYSLSPLTHTVSHFWLCCADVPCQGWSCACAFWAHTAPSRSSLLRGKTAVLSCDPAQSTASLPPCLTVSSCAGHVWHRPWTVLGVSCHTFHLGPHSNHWGDSWCCDRLHCARYAAWKWKHRDWPMQISVASLGSGGSFDN